MKFAPRPSHNPSRRARLNRGFTLAEVLAAMLFMAIVIPVAIQGLRIATLAGEVGRRKLQAARIAERIIGENMALTNGAQMAQSGFVVEGTREFRYTLTTGPWNQQTTNQLPLGVNLPGQLTVTQPHVNELAASQVTLNLLSVSVEYSVQGRDYSVSLNTLAPQE